VGLGGAVAKPTLIGSSSSTRGLATFLLAALLFFVSTAFLLPYMLADGDAAGSPAGAAAGSAASASLAAGLAAVVRRMGRRLNHDWGAAPAAAPTDGVAAALLFGAAAVDARAAAESAAA
jgi:hypothetical protein